MPRKITVGDLADEIYGDAETERIGLKKRVGTLEAFVGEIKSLKIYMKGVIFGFSIQVLSYLAIAWWIISTVSSANAAAAARSQPEVQAIEPSATAAPLVNHLSEPVAEPKATEEEPSNIGAGEVIGTLKAIASQVPDLDIGGIIDQLP